MKNPLTPIGFAVKALAATARPEQVESLEVLAAESDRLQRLAREFAELGRLPEGPAAEVDLGELLDELLRTAVPAHRPVHSSGAPRHPARSSVTTTRSAAPSATCSATPWRRWVAPDASTSGLRRARGA